MKRILITAFGNYGPWEANASWLALIALTRELPRDVSVVTRKYPVELRAAQSLLESDLAAGFDFALHLGQAPGSTCLALELFALNAFAADAVSTVDRLATDGPAAFATQLPLQPWAVALSRQGIPSRVSTHAGTYLCNAVYYWNQWLCQQEGYNTQSAFIHLPLAPEQAAQSHQREPSMHTELAADGIRRVVDWMVRMETPASGDLRTL